MPVVRAGATLAVLVSLAAPAVTAAAGAPGGTSADASPLLWTNPDRTVTCGVEIHPRRRPASRLLCGAVGLPRPHGGIGDPFATLGSTGMPMIVAISQDAYVGRRRARLAAGVRWTGPAGIRCRIATRTVRCVNSSEHGFTIAAGGYHPF